MFCFLVWLILGNAEVMWRHYSLPSCWVKQKCVFSGTCGGESYRRISVATTYRLPVHGWAARVSLCKRSRSEFVLDCFAQKEPDLNLVALPPLSERDLIWVLWVFSLGWLVVNIFFPANRSDLLLHIWRDMIFQPCHKGFVLMNQVEDLEQQAFRISLTFCHCLLLRLCPFFGSGRMWEV